MKLESIDYLNKLQNNKNKCYFFECDTKTTLNEMFIGPVKILIKMKI